MAAPSASTSSAAAKKNKSENEIVCSACGKKGVEFSNRQRNKIIMGERGRCKTCVGSGTPIKSNQEPTNENKSSKAEQQEQKGRLYFSDGDSVYGESSSSSSEGCKQPDDDDTQDVSLNALKEEILGRKLVTHEDVSTIDAKEDAMTLPAIANAADLRKELSCAICHEPFWQPFSLSCGHSFCQECLKWWLTHSRQPQRAKHGTCPTCRENLVCSGESLKVNTALRACVTALYGEELAKRDQAAKLAKIKAKAGENGGIHDRGFEVVSDVGSWKRLADAGEGCLYARRSIILDDQDARMQLALAVDGLTSTSPPMLVDSRQMLQVSLYLLQMEEDEAEDSGFPLILKDEDDEHLISNDGRFNSTTVTTSFIVDGDDANHRDVAEESIGSDGTARFKIPTEPEFFGKCPMYIRFVHEGCGAVYEISYSKNEVDRWQQVNEDREARALVEVAARDRIAENIDDDESDHGPNEYEEDGFLVMHDEVEESADDSEYDDDAEEDVCCVCREHGELIICDGGDHLEGCGKSFHIHCVRRDQVPPGDWICGDCASTIDLDVGLVGHEFPAEGETFASNRKSIKRVLEDSSGDESDGSVEVLAPVSKNKVDANKRSRILESDNEDD